MSKGRRSPWREGWGKKEKREKREKRRCKGWKEENCGQKTREWKERRREKEEGGGEVGVGKEGGWGVENAKGETRGKLYIEEGDGKCKAGRGRKIV